MAVTSASFQSPGSLPVSSARESNKTWSFPRACNWYLIDWTNWQPVLLHHLLLLHSAETVVCHRFHVIKDFNQSFVHSCSTSKFASVPFCSLAILVPRVGHTMDVLSPFVSILCHSDWLFHRESCPRLDPGRAWSSSPACTWHCSLHYFFLQAIPWFPHGVTIVC